MTRAFSQFRTLSSRCSVRTVRGEVPRELLGLRPSHWFIRFIALFFFSILLATFARAAPLETVLSPQTGSLDDTFTLELTAHGPITAARPEVAKSDDFEVQYVGPQSITQIFNGSVEQRTIFVFQLTPKREGLLQTPRIVVEIEGQQIGSNQLTIPVTKDSPTPLPDPDLILRQTINPSTAFVGQQLRYQLEFMTASPVAETTLPDLTIESFRSELLGEDTQSLRYERGKQYRTISIQRALFPLTSGATVIPERTLRLRKIEPVRLPGFPFGGGSPFDDPFFGSTKAKSVTVRAAEIPVTVLPLPPVPAHLPGWNAGLPLVGATSVSLSYDDTPIEQGASKTIIVSITTEGSGASFKKGLLAPQPSYRVYEEPVEAKTSTQNVKLITQRLVRLSVVPLVTGTMQLGPLKISYFDPDTQSYQTATSRDITFTVMAPAGSTPAPFVSPTASPTQPTITEPQPNEPGLPEESLSSRFIRRVGLPLLVFGGVTLASLIALIILSVMRVRRIRSRRPERLKKEIANAADIHLLSHAVSAALCELLSPGAPVVEGEGLKSLVRRSLRDGGLQFEVLTFLDTLEAARFASPSLAHLDHRALSNSACLLVERISHYRIS